MDIKSGRKLKSKAEILIFVSLFGNKFLSL